MADSKPLLSAASGEDSSINGSYGSSGKLYGDRQETDHASSTNEFQTIINIVKATVGAGSFVLPFCMRQMGLIPGILTIILLGAVCVYTTLMLVRTKNMLYQATGKLDITYVDIAKHTFGSPGGITVYVLMLLASLGVAGSYLVFIGDVMNEVVCSISPIGWRAIPLAVLVPVTWLRSLRQLSYTSAVGSVALVAAMVVALAYGFRDELDHLRTFEPQLGKFDTYFTSFGSIAFLFCIQFLVLPIERAMKKHENFPRALSTSFFIIAVFNILFAVLCYYFWGNCTRDIILSNMNEDVLTDVVKVCVCVDLMFTYPLVFAPGREIVENFLLNPEHKYITLQRNALRTLLVGVTFGLAMIPSFSVITNLVGIPMSVLAFVLPPMMELRLLGFANVPKVKVILYCALAFTGLAICIVTTIYSFLGYDDDYEQYNCPPQSESCTSAEPTEPTLAPEPTAVVQLAAAVVRMLRASV